MLHVDKVQRVQGHYRLVRSLHLRICIVFLVDNFCLLAHYVDLWLMGGFIETLERFVEEKFAGIKTNLATTLQMLECACIVRYDSSHPIEIRALGCKARRPTPC